MGVVRIEVDHCEHRVGLVITKVIVIGSPGVEIERNEITLRVQGSANFERERRPLGIPSRFFVPHPLHSNRPANFLRQKRRFKTGVIGSSAAIRLRPIHPDHAHAIARYLEELGNAVPEAIRFHVIRINRHLPVRRIC